MLVVFSLFVQASCGCVFGIVPFVVRRCNGFVSGARHGRAVPGRAGAGAAGRVRGGVGWVSARGQGGQLPGGRLAGRLALGLAV